MRVRRKADQQTTLRRPVSLSGIGVHRAQPSTLTLHPADAGAGLVFLCSRDGREVAIPALWSSVADVTLATTLASPTHPDVTIGGVEHVLAALQGAGIDNAMIEVDGPEVPILDGSARPFLNAIAAAGVRRHARPRRSLEVLKPVRVDIGASFAELRPAALPRLSLTVSIDYRDPAVGQQRHEMVLGARSFASLAPSRTFGFTTDAERLWAQGFAQGASLENTVVIAGGRVLNAGGLRSPDEFVRHKMLDAIGDLALAGAPLRAQFRSHRGGHALNVALLRALFADASAWRHVEHPAQSVRASRAQVVADAPL